MSPSIGLSHLEAALNNLYCWPVAYVTHLYSLSLLLPFGFCWVKPVFLWELYHDTIGSQSVWGTMTYRHASLPQLQYMVGECLVGHTLISDYKLLSTTIKKFQAIPVLPMDYGNGRPSWKLWTSSSRRSNSQPLAARSWHCGCHKNRRVLWRHRRWREVPWLHRILRSGGLKWGETQRHGDNRNTTKEEDGIWPETIVYPAICNLYIYYIYISLPEPWSVQGFNKSPINLFQPSGIMPALPGPLLSTVLGISCQQSQYIADIAIGKLNDSTTHSTTKWSSWASVGICVKWEDASESEWPICIA